MSPNATTPVHHLSLRSVLEKEKLNDTNFLDWYRNLRIVLKVEKKSYILDGPVPEEPPTNATKSIRDACTKHMDDSTELKEMFQQQARQQRFETVRALHACKMTEGTSRLGSSIGPELAIDLIPNSLPKSYDQFVLNYNMSNLEKSISELHLMLKTAEKNIPSKTSKVLMIREGKIKKPQAKGKGKGKPKSQGNYKGKKFIPKDSVKKKEKPAKDATCFHCGEIGHWKRNCPTYLAELKKTKASNASTSGIYMIELFVFSSNSWVFDTGCGTHICNNVQGLRKIKKLKPGDLVLHVGNGAHVAVVAIGTYELLLPNDMKMTKAPFSSSGERAKDLLGLIHFDAFETFKVFQNEVQNQLGKTIKVLRSDRGELEEIQESQNITPEVGTSYQQIVEEPEQLVAQEPEVTQDIRRSSRPRHSPQRYDDIFLVDESEPTNYKDATLDPEFKKWNEAMNEEMQSMYDNEVWDLVDLPPDSKAVGSKWIFKKKTYMDGNVHTFKARLVAKGFTQTHGVDYDETFSPVAMLKSIRILIAIAAYYDYEIWQMDVKTPFLNGYLSEDVYMEQPEGFVNPKYPNKVCKLKRAIYRLKQASRSWNLRFDEKIKEFDFIQNEDDICVYKRASGSIVVFLILYVDDILLIGNDIPTLQKVKSWLGKCFQMKDLGDAAYILGIKIHRDRSKRLIGLSQSAYIEKILK
ncbi:uncharacterized protein [Rutidosis leptorrhynchoides]|uniref:uncharacterized protein n=1 Tax=Rutidosis leptorrhynchoides TaxID=125765 RepID=UPI003A990613